MLERIRIRNFQTHERLQIDLDPRITAITGPSDAGKSAVLRALRWVARNRPRGEGFVREGAERASVRVRFDGTNVMRGRGKENTYKIDGKELKAFGSDVPEEVRQVLNLGEINFQGQHEAPFWFDLTPGELAKRLNDIVDLSLIDQAQSFVAGRVRSLNAEEKVVRDRLEEAEQQMGELDFVESLDEDLVELEGRQEKASSLVARASRLEAIVSDLSKHGERRDRLVDTVSRGLTACSVGEEWEGFIGELSDLENLLDEIDCCSKKVDREIPNTDPIGEALGGWRDLFARGNLIGSMADEIEEHRETLGRLEGSLEEAKAELEESLQGRCPLCGSEIDEKSLLSPS